MTKNETPGWANDYASSIELALFKAGDKAVTTPYVGSFLVEATHEEIGLISLQRNTARSTTIYSAERAYQDESEVSRTLNINVTIGDDGTIGVVAKDGQVGEEPKELDFAEIGVEAQYIIELLQ